MKVSGLSRICHVFTMMEGTQKTRRVYEIAVFEQQHMTGISAESVIQPLHFKCYQQEKWVTKVGIEWL